MDYVRFYARVRPGRVAVHDIAGQRQLNYAELDAEIARCSTLLIGEGMAPGGRVACLSRNRVEQVILQLACARVGAIFVPLNWRLSRREIVGLIEDCEPDLLLGDELAQEMGLAHLDIATLSARCTDLAPWQSNEINTDAPSLMLYTSGTTGSPRGVLLSERNLFETAHNFSVLGEVDSSSVVLCESPMFHIIGMVTSIRPALLWGAKIVISDGFVPERTLARLSDPLLGISHYFCVPQMALSLRAADNFDSHSLASLKALFTGGAPHPEAQIRDWLDDGIAIVDGYGSTECGTVFGMALDRELIDRKAGSVGLSTPRVETRLVDTDGRPVARGEAGELQVRGDNVTAGYWRRDADYRAAMTDDGWFCTGDIAQQDEDGFFYIVDRKKDMYISGGENVYPAEIEALLVKYPGVSELAVVGVPDEKWGEVGCVFYVSEDTAVSAEDFESFLAGKIARYKLPRAARRLEQLPRNSAGKLLKPELKKRFHADGETAET